MAEDRWSWDTISCSICLEVLKDPVTLPCGHNHCMSCIRVHLDTEDEWSVHSCPQCRQTFTSRPYLQKNTMLAALVEQLKKTGLQAAPADHCYAGAEDVACDSCSGRKLKAVKSCLQCLVSFCDQHLQPHHQSPAYEKHKLVEPHRNLDWGVCSRHNEVMTMFCRTDRQIICHLCSTGDHRVHRKVSIAEERTDRQKSLQEKLQLHIQDREEGLKLLQQQVEDISRSADKTVEDSQKIFTQLIRLMEMTQRDVEQQVRSLQEAEVSRVKELEKKLEQEIRELKRKDAELKKLSDTVFLQNDTKLPEFTHTTRIRPRWVHRDHMVALAQLTHKLQQLLKESWTNMSPTETAPGPEPGPEPEPEPRPGPEPGPEPEPEPRPGPEPVPETRAELLRYWCEITLDQNTAHRRLLLSRRSRRAARVDLEQPYTVEPYPGHRGRFTDRIQVLSRESLTGRCYWEVKGRGDDITVAVAYQSIRRSGRSHRCQFGKNDRSWALESRDDGYYFRHDDSETELSGPRAFRVGVYLDHSAGVLAFFRVTRALNVHPLIRVHTTFTQPLYAGLGFPDAVPVFSSVDAEFCQLEQAEVI